ncbi:MAG: hypothetical protein MJY97_01295 [Bacteroidales bacterium]|nr:hypothetical protein [Bacteroidales bacterium]
MEERELVEYEAMQEKIMAGAWKAIEAQGVDADCLAGFDSQIGKLYKSKGDPVSILVSGRASNGWKHGSKASDRPHLFPVHRSAFITVCRLIADHFYGDQFPEDHLVWTNTFRISDCESGNPTKYLWAAQYNSMCQIAALEQECLCPDVSIYMTGIKTDWDSPLWDGYLNHHGWSKVIHEDSIVNRGGRLCRMMAYKCQGRIFIITDRPESFSRKLFAEAVIKVIEHCLRR